MHSQNEDLARKMRALENEMAGLRLDNERRERLVQEERAALAQRLAAIQSESSQEVSRDCRGHMMVDLGERSSALKQNLALIAKQFISQEHIFSLLCSAVVFRAVMKVTGK